MEPKDDNLPEGVIDILSNGAYVYAPGKEPRIPTAFDVGRFADRGFEILDSKKYLEEINSRISHHGHDKD